jgi:hypothetical protein
MLQMTERPQETREQRWGGRFAMLSQGGAYLKKVSSWFVNSQDVEKIHKTDAFKWTEGSSQQ